MRPGKDLYRRVRRLQRRGPLQWTVREKAGQPFERSTVRDEAGVYRSPEIPIRWARKIQAALATGRPVLITLFQRGRRGEAFLEKRSRRLQPDVATRLEWIQFRRARR